jgi:transposase-like protein
VKSADSGRANPEVSDKPRRRRFSAAYKLKVLRESDRCTKPGEFGALLRREGIYSSSLSAWRRQRESGELSGLKPKKRGRKAKPKDHRDKLLAEQERELKRLKRKLSQAETVIEVQKKVASLLGIPLKSVPDDESE